MSKQIKMTFSNGDLYSIPLEFVANHRADYYAKSDGFGKGSTQYVEEVDFVLSDNFEGIDWLQNNMNWEDVEHVAVRIDEGHVDFREELCNCEKEII